MGRSESSQGTDFSAGTASELPEHAVWLSPFAIDRYEVTVGRFRKFVENYDVWHAQGGNPKVGDGKNPAVAASGWGQSWSPAANDLPTNAAALLASIKCDAASQTWADAATSALTESYPINCVTWYQAAAFCIWDGGRLATEAEWEYVAAGGSLNRLYPWGASVPDPSRANFSGSDHSPFVAVGSKAANGQGYFGHLDLAGSVSEWNLDWYSGSFYAESSSSVPCNNCASVISGSGRALRGIGWYFDSIYLRSAYRTWGAPGIGDVTTGIRCARAVP